MDERIAFTTAYRAPFIVLEGTDGSGISTQTGLLAAALRERHVKVCTTKQPSDGPIGAMIRLGLAKRLNEVTMSPELQARRWALFFAADRLDHYCAEVMPKVNGNVTVICDRYDLSSYAYQGSVLKEKEFEWLWALNKCPMRPDLTIVVKVPPEVSLQRIKLRNWHFELFETDHKLTEVYEAYEKAICFLKSKGDHIVEIDGTASKEEVHAEILRHVEHLVGHSCPQQDERQ